MSTPGIGLQPVTGYPLIDAMTNGTYWSLDGTRTISWAISNFGPWTWSAPASVAGMINSALQTFAQYANIQFTYTGYYTDPVFAPADMVFSLDGSGLIFSSPTVWARGFFPNVELSQLSMNAEMRAIYTTAPGDIWLNLQSGLELLEFICARFDGLFGHPATRSATRLA